MTDATQPTTTQPTTTLPTTTGARERNPRGEGERLRRELLVSALDLLSESADPDDVSIRAVARRTGVSPTAAYRHFVDRDDLVYCAVGVAFEEFAGRLLDAVGDAPDPFTALEQAGVAYRTYAEEQPGRYRVLFSNPMACPDSTSATDDEVEAGHQAFGVLVDLVQACLDAGAPAAAAPLHGDAAADATYLARLMWTWIHGIADLRITHPDMGWPDAARMFGDAQRLLGLSRPA